MTLVAFQMKLYAENLCERVKKSVHFQKKVITYRSSRPVVFCKKGALRNFTKYSGKHLCQSLFFNKVLDLRPATLLKKRLWHRCFPANFVKFLRTPFYIEHFWWLLLNLETLEGIHKKNVTLLETSLLKNYGKILVCHPKIGGVLTQKAVPEKHRFTTSK